MTIKFAKSCLLAGALLIPYMAHSADVDADRKDPVTFVQDSAITAKVKAKLAAEHVRSLAQISVDTDANGMVVLTGKVRSKDEADKVVQIARDTEGVNSVVSNLQIRKDD
jgi:hyperosmotically inducible protein